MSEARVDPRGTSPGTSPGTPPGTPPVRVGFIGLGRMGAPMCRHLLRVGHVLTVHDRTPAREGPLVPLGATRADSPGAVAAGCDVVIACLDTVAASEAVFLAGSLPAGSSRPPVAGPTCGSFPQIDGTTASRR